MRFSTFLLLFLFLSVLLQPHSVKAQNLIYDWSVEEYDTCPTGLALTLFIPHWLSFRGNPDYFNTCSPDLGPLTNPFGWQHPRTGEAHMGVITFHTGLTNGREYTGVELLAPLTVGESYDISFYAALAYNQSVSSNRASNNLGILLMTENYLTTNELGIIPNFAHHFEESLVTDTANWVHISGSIVADSAYKFAAFGNFFDDQNTQVISFNPADPSPGNLAYYYFDDFCVVPAGGECNLTLSSPSAHSERSLLIYPNPSSGSINIESETAIRSLKLFTCSGTFIQSFNIGNQREFQVDLSRRPVGMYVLQIETEEGITRRKVVIKP